MDACNIPVVAAPTPSSITAGRGRASNVVLCARLVIIVSISLPLQFLLFVLLFLPVLLFLLFLLPLPPPLLLLL